MGSVSSRQQKMELCVSDVSKAIPSVEPFISIQDNKMVSDKNMKEETFISDFLHRKTSVSMKDIEDVNDHEVLVTTVGDNLEKENEQTTPKGHDNRILVSEPGLHFAIAPNLGFITEDVSYIDCVNKSDCNDVAIDADEGEFIENIPPSSTDILVVSLSECSKRLARDVSEIEESENDETGNDVVIECDKFADDKDRMDNETREPTTSENIEEAIHNIQQKENENELKSDDNTKERDDGINFDDSEMYFILDQYKKRVRKDLFSKTPDVDVLQEAQDMGLKTSSPIHMNKNGIPLPLPYTCSLDCKIEHDIVDANNKMTLKELIIRLKDKQIYVDQKSKLKLIFDVVINSELRNFKEEAETLLGLELSEEHVDPSVHIFHRICRLIGITCKIIEGRVKMLTSGNNENNWSSSSQWIAVLHGDLWKLIDPHPIDKHAWETNNCLIMGSSYLKSRAVEHLFRRQICKQFFVNPCEHISLYYPSETYWQLLCRPVTFSEWQNMVYCTPYFNELSLKMVKPESFHIDLFSTRNTSIKILFPPKRKLQFAARFCTYKGLCFDKSKLSYTYVETDTEKGLLEVKLSAPDDGLLKIFAMDVDISVVHILVCCFNINLNDKNNMYSTIALGFPRNMLRFEWGPSNDTKICGLVPISHKRSEINCENNSVLIEFQRSKDDYVYDFSLDTTDEEQEDISRRFVFYWFDNDRITFRISNPFQGCFIFNIMKKDTIFSSHNASVCSYLIIFHNEPKCNCIPPNANNGRHGITNYGRKEKLIFTDCVNGIIKSTTSGEVTLKLQNFNGVQVQPRLHLITSCFHNMMRHVFITYNGNLILVRINLPRRGDYLFSLFSSEEDKDSECLYNGLIFTKRPSIRWAPFPELYTDRAFNIGVFSPKAGVLASRTVVYFSVEIPNSLDVAAVSCKGWTHLEQTSSGIWEGSVTTGYAGTDIRIMARFEKGSEEFDRILTYKVIPSSDAENKTMHQQLLVRHPQADEFTEDQLKELSTTNN